MYNININKPFTFVDIGMNVGITSLFFAQKYLCTKVIAFEPFCPTIAIARKNLERNKISEKIEVHETGLGYPARIINSAYSESFKGSVGINGIAAYVSAKDITEESLKIMDVFEALKDIHDDRIILKIDCEGAEYEILERLNDTCLLSRFDVIMIEWHLKGTSVLEKILLGNGYKVLSFDGYNNVGMLYAIK